MEEDVEGQQHGDDLGDGQGELPVLQHIRAPARDLAGEPRARCLLRQLGVVDNLRAKLRLSDTRGWKTS